MPTCRQRRKGLSLVELLLASTAMAIIAAALGTLATSIHVSNDYCQQQGQALMHGRATWLRIADCVANAQTSESFPGCITVSNMVGSYQFPETLVVWKPSGSAATPTGLPRVNELVIYTPNPQTPNELWQLTAPSSTATAPAVTDAAGWLILISNLRSSSSSQKIVLTDRLRTASTDIVSAGANPSTSNLRGSVRFRVIVKPTVADMAAYRAGTTPLANLGWPLDLYGQKSALRSVVCLGELQLATDPTNNSADTTLAYFGAATLRYPLAP